MHNKQEQQMDDCLAVRMKKKLLKIHKEKLIIISILTATTMIRTLSTITLIVNMCVRMFVYVVRLQICLNLNSVQRPVCM